VRRDEKVARKNGEQIPQQVCRAVKIRRVCSEEGLHTAA